MKAAVVHNWGEVWTGGSRGAWKGWWRPGVRHTRAVSFTSADFEFTEPFLGSHAIAQGAVTDRALRSLLFTRLLRNVYVASTVSVTHLLRCKAAALVAPPSAVLTGCSAAAVRGVELVGAHDPVELVLPESVLFARQDGVHIRRTSRGAIDSEPWHESGWLLHSVLPSTS